MPPSTKVIITKPATQATSANTTDSGKIRLGGACRLPAKTADSGKIRLGGACRLPIRGA